MPTGRVEIDWADNGYQHAKSNVSDDLREYSVDCGMATASNPYEFINQAARGRMTLENPDDAYNVVLSTDIDTQLLLKRHACRITSVYDDGETRVLWEGFAGAPEVDERSGAKHVNIKLEGRLLRPYSESYTVDVDFDASVEWHADSLFDLIGSAYTLIRDHETAPLTWPVNDADGRASEYQGTVLGFLNALSDYAGAYGLEDRCGYFGMYDGLRIAELPSACDIFAEDTLMLHDVSRVWDRFELVKNRVIIQGDDHVIQESADTYGVQEMRVPPFFKPAGDLYTINNVYWLLTYLVHRSVPLTYAELTIPRDQGNRKAIERLEPGAAFNLRVTNADGIDVDAKFWCAGCTYTNFYNAPAEITAYAIDTAWSVEPDGFVLGQGRLGVDALGDGS